MPTPTPRLLILGGGAVVTEYYVPALHALGWQHEALIAEPSQRAIEAIGALAASIRVDALDFETALADTSIGSRFDAAVVAVPNALHERAAELALKRGLHVLCEKPLAMSSEACCRLATVAEQAGRTLGVGMVRRLLPSFELLQQAISSRLIGDLIRIDAQDGEPYAWLSDSGASFRPENGGVLTDMGVHYLDFLQELCGPLTPLSYTDDCRGGVEANALFELRTQDGIPLNVQLSRTRRLANRMVCMGTRGSLSLAKDKFDRCVWRAEDSNATLLVRDEAAAGSLEDAFKRQLLEFVTGIRNGAAPRVSADRASTTMRLIEWAYSQRHGKAAAAPSSESASLEAGPVFITGGTGFIGSHLVERLSVTAPNSIVAAVRSYRTCAEIARFPISLPRVDLLDSGAVRQALRGARYVFHLAYGREDRDAERITVDATRTVVEAAIAEQCEAVVVLSTIYVFGRHEARVDESSAYAPVGGAYGRTKTRMEQWCLSRAASSPRTRIVVLNPGCVYGPRGSTYSEMPSRLAHEGAFCWIDQGRGIANYTYVGNLVDAMLAAATCVEAHGQRFIVCDGSTTWRTFLEGLLGPGAAELLSYTRAELQDLHRRRPRPALRDLGRIIANDPDVRSVIRESRTGELALRAVDRVAPRMLAPLRAKPARQQLTAEPTRSNNKPLPPEWLSDLFGPESTVFVADRAHDVLGWTPRISLEDGMQHTRMWLDQTGGSADSD
jgi:predicted dehydrogenase/nucleoside-diphosphate-sugar epimerase